MGSQPLYTSNQMFQFDRCFSHRNVDINAPHLIPYIKDNSRIIDVGCSTGAITMSLARRVPNGYVLGIDHEPETIAIARAAAKEAGLTNVEFSVANAEDMGPLDQDPFDIAHAHQTLLHVTYPTKVLKEMRRVIKTGGVVSTRDNCHVFRYPDAPLLNKHLDKFIAASRARGAHPTGSHVNHIWMNEAGFPWESIEMGGAAWDWSSLEYKRLWTSGVLAGGLRNVEGDNTNEILREVDEWVKKPETRILALDSWVIGHK